MIGSAACIVYGIIYEENHTIQRCILLEKTIWWSRNDWKKYRHKCLKAQCIQCTSVLKFFLCDSLNLCAVKACILLSKILNKWFYIYFSSRKWTACFITVSFTPDSSIGQLCEDLNKIAGYWIYYDTFEI